MSRLFDTIASGVAGKPRVVLVALLIATVALAAGTGLLGEQGDSTVFLPESSEVAEASDVLSEAFPDSAGLAAITTLHRGEILTPAGLDHIDRTLAATIAQPGVAERLALVDPVITPTQLFKGALQVEDLSSVSQAQIDGVVQAANTDPELAALGTALAALVGEADGTGLAITSVRLRTLDDPDGLEDVELATADLVETIDGPLDVRSLSSATTSEESDEAVASSMTRLMLIALAVIAAVLYLFFRTGSDVALSLLGLGVIIVGTLGAQGWMGPDGLGIIGQPNTLTTLVPIMLIGLSVDYAIQSVSHYREIRVTGAGITESVCRGLRGVLLPLGLAAGTTVISFLTNVASPIPANQDFGLVAGFGVLWGLVVMLTLIPAARAFIDGRKATKSTLGPVRPMADAIPGAGVVVERVGVAVANAPMLILGVVGVVTIALGVASTNLSTEFNSNDFLPGGGDSITDLEALDEAFGGQTELVNVLIDAELTDDRTLRNLLEISTAFDDELSRPDGAATAITSSLGTFFRDWSTDDGPDDANYDPGLLAQAESIDQGLTIDPAGAQALLDRLQELDPVGFSLVASDNPDGTDLSLLQFSAFTGDQDRTKQMVADLRGSGSAMTPKSRPPQVTSSVRKLPIP